MWNDVWYFLSSQFAKAFDVLFNDFTPLGSSISIGAIILGFTIIHKIIDLLVPFAGGTISERGTPEKPTQQEKEHNNYWMFRGG